MCESYKVPETLSELDDMEDAGQIEYIAQAFADESGDWWSQNDEVTFTQKGTFWIYISTGFNNYIDHEWRLWAEGLVEDEPPKVWEVVLAFLISVGLIIAIVIYFLNKRSKKKKLYTG